jgi:hypothetical protein
MAALPMATPTMAMGDTCYGDTYYGYGRHLLWPHPQACHTLSRTPTGSPPQPEP